MVTLGFLLMVFGFVAGFILDFIVGTDVYKPRIPKWCFGLCTIAVLSGSALIVLGLIAALIVSLA